jgi:hypothetical protein
MSWRLAKSLEKLRLQINNLAPARSKSSDGTIGDAAHASRSSDHNPWIHDGAFGVVSALDITHDPEHGVDIARLAAVLSERRDPRIKYIIANKQICSSITSPWTWRPYSGSNPHTKHIHISVHSKKSLYDSEAPWIIGDAFSRTEPPQIEVLDTERELVAALEEAAQAKIGFALNLDAAGVVSLLNSLKQDD